MMEVRTVATISSSMPHQATILALLGAVVAVWEKYEERADPKDHTMELVVLLIMMEYSYSLQRKERLTRQVCSIAVEGIAV